MRLETPVEPLKKAALPSGREIRAVLGIAQTCLSVCASPLAVAAAEGEGRWLGKDATLFCCVMTTFRNAFGKVLRAASSRPREGRPT